MKSRFPVHPSQDVPEVGIIKDHEDLDPLTRRHGFALSGKLAEFSFPRVDPLLKTPLHFLLKQLHLLAFKLDVLLR